MKYALVATTGWLLLVDLQTKKVQALENGRPEYYGISWFRDDNNLVLSHTGLDSATLTDINAYALSERGWLSKGDLRSRNFLSAPHQIFCAPDYRVICANTGRNVINVFDFKKPNVYQECGVTDARWDRLSLDDLKGDHLNSVFLRGNLLYVIAHGFLKGSKLAIFSYPDLELVSVEPLGNRTGLHNIWITNDGQRVSCHSENGSLIDLDSRLPIWESGSAIYTRGLAATNDYVLIGESQKTVRDLRRSSLSGIWILSRNDWKAIDHICLGPYGAVNEIRVLDEPDEAHHGHRYTGLVALCSQDAYTDLSLSRLSTSAAASAAAVFWSDFAGIFGSPAFMNNGAKSARSDQLCLVVKKNDQSKQIDFSYSLDDPFESHVSAIAGYQGNGADKCMNAFLLKSFENQAILSLWKNDGECWAHVPGVQIDKQPLTGKVRLVVSQNRVTLYINSKIVLECPAQIFGATRCDFGLGIRWMGAAVRPEEVAN
ncbi:MAG: hypothetical protein LWW96_05125 [Acidovorax sp.]|uniref:hypothetical protein n=1 Tax=Acidovorax sp. TaxID=1872122 RepID=UPI0025C691F6|nr:hypothetical protein [Acidovorax sp.]MCE1191518.1 hypothetical protein [Acidovorax sp.]